MSKGTQNKPESTYQKPVKQELQQIEIGSTINKHGKTGSVIWMGIQNDVSNVKVRWNDGTIEFFVEKDLQ
jgi:hypothetical protein